VQFEFLFDRERTTTPDAPQREANQREEWLRVGVRQLRLRLVRHPRARRYVLRLRSDGIARVTIPRRGSWLEGRRFANRNIRWLEKQLLRQANRSFAAKEWTTGTEILFRGEKVRLELVANPGQLPRPLSMPPHREMPKLQTANAISAQDQGLPSNNPEGIASFSPGLRRWQVQLGPSYPGFGTPEVPNPERVAPLALPQEWQVRFGNELLLISCKLTLQTSKHLDLRPCVERHLRELATHELPLRVAELAKEHQFEVRRVSVRNQRSRWGSCSRRGTISLNWRLVQTPIYVRDYIILHELAHLKEMNHSKRFWREVARLCPEFVKAEQWLKEHPDLFK
jgi:predicted metal-dependent hydrolase